MNNLEDQLEAVILNHYQLVINHQPLPSSTVIAQPGKTIESTIFSNMVAQTIARTDPMIIAW